MMRSWIIHMEAATARRPLVEALLRDLPNASVLPAVVGRDLTDIEIARAHVAFRYAPRYPFPLLPGELGCFLSHRAAWERIVATTDPFGLIVEDDARLDPATFPAALALAREHAAADRIVRLPIRDRETPRETLSDGPGPHAFRPRVVGLGTTCQIVGRTAAARLLELTQPFDRPVDAFLQMRWLTRIDTITVLPSGVVSAASETGGSAIQSRRGAWSELQRTVSRAWYRGQVRSLSRRMS